MSVLRVTGVLLAIACGGVIACSDAARPPPIADPDPDASIKVPYDAGTIPPCSSPAPGCPCGDAGAQVSCGLVYRVSGTHLECSPGYFTCQEDGGWSGCVGAAIYDGG